MGVCGQVHVIGIIIQVHLNVCVCVSTPLSLPLFHLCVVYIAVINHVTLFEFTCNTISHLIPVKNNNEGIQ